MQLPGRQSTGNTHISEPPAVQFAALVQKLPPTEHVPDAQFADVVQKFPVFAQWLEQSLARKQLWVVPMHWPGMQVPEAQPLLDVHAAPPGAVAVQTGVGMAPKSQNRSVLHCVVDVHGALTPSFA